MTIISRQAVRDAYDRALALHNDPEAALQAAAQALHLPEEVVAACVLEVAA
ncbi:hypothetical protein [Acidovorax sp. PRC11]|uniref:hypothetical protein n=1 Tax=Acidovorax sp. PRC11 TaxID=2962592 RepID=UPI0028827912|nr:hypothetical protein [Acidovorax sp. PRC11]MDT0140187.1 hypothetical protein [Acidovorax sp. PRC11]